ncbi:hypothetical protein [Pseudonocardia sp. GCM10023141]|uniref:hypothetical protein n=1 Tax=Pseudonocardia sp. GCM10023141 TaxID=3252653 RepID=UPI00360B683F
MTAPIAPGSLRRLVVADQLLHNPDLIEDGAWPRACTWLIRLALEHALDDYWERRRPDVAAASRRAQLLTLTRTVDRDLGQSCTNLWHTLSRAAHHHAYELSPTSTELRGWHRGVYNAAADLAGR